jgi:redox-regulated HSP33 family molecular chaperone
MIRNLLAIGKDELDNLAMDEAGITLECHFCNMKYHFDQKQVQDFTQQAMRKTPPEPCQNR